MKILITNKKDSILEYFIKNPTEEFHLRELARNLKISFPWVRKTVEELVKGGFLNKKRERGFVLISANRENELFRALKRSYNLFSLSKSGLIKHLVDSYTRPEAIILFGSYSRGEDTENSDIDIAVITKRNEVIDIRIFEKILQRKIKVLELQQSKIEKEFWNTLINGIVVYGYLENEIFQSAYRRKEGIKSKS